MCCEETPLSRTQAANLSMTEECCWQHEKTEDRHPRPAQRLAMHTGIATPHGALIAQQTAHMHQVHVHKLGSPAAGHSGWGWCPACSLVPGCCWWGN